jgi:hypothetical protein
MLEEAGAAIAKWFAGLSGAALHAAILKAFQQFDTDDSGLLNRCSAPPSAPDRQERARPGERSKAR